MPPQVKLTSQHKCLQAATYGKKTNTSLESMFENILDPTSKFSC